MRRGRQAEIAALAVQWGADIPDPQSPETFLAAKLAWAWPEGSPQAQLRRLYQDLLAARRHWPALRDRRHTMARSSILCSTGETIPAVRVGCPHGAEASGGPGDHHEAPHADCGAPLTDATTAGQSRTLC